MKKIMALTLAVLLPLSMITMLPASAIIKYDTVYNQDFTTFTTATAAIAALKTDWNVGTFSSLTSAADASVLWTAADGFKSASWSTYAQTSSKTALSNYRFTTKLRTTGTQWAAIAVRESLTNATLPGYGSGNVAGKSAQGITFVLSGATASTTTTMAVIIRDSTSSFTSDPYEPDTIFTVPFPSSTANYFGIADRTIVITDRPNEITLSADGNLIARVTIDTTSTNADGSYNKGEVFDGSGVSKGTFSVADNAKIPASGMIDIFQRNNIFSLKSIKLEKEFSFSSLEAKIAEAEAYETAPYTAESYAVLSEKISAGRDLMLQSDATMIDVNNAVLAIDNAIAGLTYKEDYFMLKPEIGAKAGKINIGSIVFTDRPTYKVINLPSQFTNAGYIQSSISYTYATALRDGYVYVITPMASQACSQVAALLERGFRKTSIQDFDLFSGQAESIEVYTKYVYAQTEIALGKWSVVLFSETNLLADIGELDGPMAILDLPEGETKKIMKPGEAIFSDNAYTFQTVPNNFLGRGYVQSGINTVSFTAEEEGYVYAITPDTGSYSKAEYLEQSGFVKTAIADFDMSADITEAVSTYKKYFEKNETFTSAGFVVIVCSELDEPESPYVRPELLAPDVYTSPDVSYYRGVRVWQGIPGIERASNGRLWATWFSGGTQEPKPENYAVVATSMDNGRTWKEPIVIIDTLKGEARVYDPVPWIDPTGKLWIFWTQATGVGDPYMDFGIWAITTEDPTVEHPVWSEPKRYGDGVMINKPIILSTGEWMLCSSRRMPADSSEVYMSTDQGETWVRQGAATITAPNSCDENMLIEKNDGSLWLLARTAPVNGGIDESFSYDKGKTWTIGKAASISGPGSRFHIRRLKSGNLLLINHYNFTGRNNMTALLSTDDGATWPYHLTLDERTGVSYPDAIEAPDGKIYAIYDYGRNVNLEICMAVFTEEDIMAGAFVSEGSATKIPIKESRRKFDFDYGTEGFIAQNNIKIDSSSEAGILAATVTGSDAYILNKSVNIDSKYNKIKIRLKNTTSSTAFELYFSTSVTAMSATTRKGFFVQGNMTDYQDVVFDMSDVETWTGIVKILRFDIANSVTSGMVYIDSIELYTDFDVIYSKNGVDTSNKEEADKIEVTISDNITNELTPILAVYRKTDNALVSCRVGQKGQKAMSVEDITAEYTVKLLCLNDLLSIKPLLKPKVVY